MLLLGAMGLATMGLVTTVLFSMGCISPTYTQPSYYVFGLIGNDGTRLQEEREAGIDAQVFDLSWRKFYPSEGQKDTAYVQRKKDELAKLRDAGFEVILSLGYHDTPPWLHQNYQNSHYVDQFGQRYTGDTFPGGTPTDNGDANLVFNPQLRALVESYMEDVFSELGTDFYAVRLGGGRYGELTYPPASFGSEENLYWAYDENAKAENPAAGWKPGDPSHDGSAEEFLEWYLNSLVDYQNWQISTLRGAGYSGRVMMLYPSWGIRPGQLETAVSANLDGTTSAEKNGEVQRGYDFARQVGAISDPEVVVTTTWLEPNHFPAGDYGQDQLYWSPVHYLASLTRAHPLSLELYGENGGRDDRVAMELSAERMERYGLLGMAWYREEELFSGQYATLEDYRNVIQTLQQEV